LTCKSILIEAVVTQVGFGSGSNRTAKV